VFRRRHNRKVALRFLAWHILGIEMQKSSHGHDSIEDAITSLALYKLYLKQMETPQQWMQTLQVLFRLLFFLLYKYQWG
jgi:hypothetical protein